MKATKPMPMRFALVLLSSFGMAAGAAAQGQTVTGNTGIPGARIATVDGVIIEADQYGRYHLEDGAQGRGGALGRGINYPVKIDPSSVPEGALDGAENPQVRRITPGMTSSFDLAGAGSAPAAPETMEIEVNDAIFVPGQRGIRPEYLAAVDRLAETIEQKQIRTLVLTDTTGNGTLANQRATSLRNQLQQKLGEGEVLDVRIESSSDTTAPVMGNGETGGKP